MFYHEICLYATNGNKDDGFMFLKLNINPVDVIACGLLNIQTKYDFAIQQSVFAQYNKFRDTGAQEVYNYLNIKF